MQTELTLFFGKLPDALPLFELLYQKMRKNLGDFSASVHKTQITFANRHGFAFVSLPRKKIKDPADLYIVVTFGLAHRVEDERIAVSVEPYPGRWTHHVHVKSPDEIDGQLMGWIEEAYMFALLK